MRQKSLTTGIILGRSGFEGRRHFGGLGGEGGEPQIGERNCQDDSLRRARNLVFLFIVI